MAIPLSLVVDVRGKRENVVTRSTVSKSDLANVLEVLSACGLKPSAVEVLPGRVRFCVVDERDLTLPDQAGEVERLKERLGANGQRAGS